jgi:uncharacterized protein YndB with AHSA1/START domain
MTIKQRYRIRASVQDVWRGLTDARTVEAWGGGPADITDQEGSEFKLWGGDIHGINREVIPFHSITQEWSIGDDWNSPSVVTLTLTPDGEETQVDLLHDQLPDEEVKTVEDGWNTHFFGPLKEYLENN